MSKKHFRGYIINPRFEFIVDEKFENILTQASTHGKKIRLTVSEGIIEKYLQKCDNSDTGKDAKGKNEVDITSVGLLQK